MFKKLKKINLLKILNLANIQRQTILLVSLGIFVFINLLISGLSLRFDFSSGQAYTLSPATKRILRKLDDIVTVKFFVSSDLPTRLLPLKNEASELLNEYRGITNKISVKYLDPKKDQSAADQAKEIGLPELQFSQLEKDKYAVSSSFFGIVLAYGGKIDMIPQVTDLESLEYNLTSAIYRLTNKELAKIGIVGQEEASASQAEVIGTLKRILGQQFNLEFLDISSASAKPKIDSSVKTVLVFDNNNKEYDDNELKLLTEYLANGGKAIVFADGIWVKDDLSTEPSRANLQKVLSAYGIKINSNLVLSTSAELVNFGNNSVTFLAPYALWIKTNVFDAKTSYFSNVNQLTYPWVSAISLEKKSGIETKQLVKSTKKSWEQKESFELNPQNIPEPKAEEYKEFITTAYAKNKNNGELIVISSSRFVLDRYLGQQSIGNLEFVLNALNDLASDGALSGIRQRAVAYYPLPDLAENQKDIFKYANILLLPGFLAVYAVFRLTRKRK